MDQRIIDLSESQQRLVAALVLGDRPVRRDELAAQLWPDAPAARAAARLRQTLWRVNQATDGRLVRTSHTTVAPVEHIEVDIRTAERLLAAASAEAGSPARGEDQEPPPTAWNALHHPLLHRWDDCWLMPFQEKWEFHRVQALEWLAERCLQRHQHAEVLELADAAAAIDPLREGPRRIAVRSCLRAGEVADAHRRYRRYRELLFTELGVAPSNAIPHLLEQARDHRFSIAAEYAEY